MLKGKSALESGGLHCSLAEQAPSGRGAPPTPPGAHRGGPREGGGAQGRRPPAASTRGEYVYPAARLLLRGDHSGDRAFSKTPLSCPARAVAFLLQVSWGVEEGKGRGYTEKKKKEKNSRDFFLGGRRVWEGGGTVVKYLIYFGGECQSVRSGWAGLGWLVCLCAPRLCGGPRLYGVCENTLSSLPTYSQPARGRVSLARGGLILKPPLRVSPHLGLRLGSKFRENNS